MASYVTAAFSELIEETLDNLYADSERPLQVTVGSNALSGASDTDFTLATSAEWEAVNTTDILESGSELLLVTAKSADATPVFTVVRGYSGTTKVDAATGATMLLNPLWTRERIKRALTRCFRSVLATHLPYIKATTLFKVANTNYMQVPAEALRVTGLGYVDPNNKKYVPLHQWQMEDNLPVTGITGVTTGKLVTLNPVVTNTTTLLLSYERAYKWTTGDTAPASEADTVELHFGSEPLPALWAAAFLVAGREVTRLQIDKVEEWNHEASVRAGVNLRMVRDLWQGFYRALDEARRVPNMPRHRPYRKLRKV